MGTNALGMGAVVRELEVSSTALERIVTAMLAVLTPVQLDAVRELAFSQSQIASATIHAGATRMIERDKQIHAHIVSLLSRATPRA